MDQIHKRFPADQIRVLLQGYCRGTIERASVEETLGIGKTRFFALLKEYRHNPKAFSLSYKRATPAKFTGLCVVWNGLPIPKCCKRIKSFML
jgi:hypothetical protein